MNQFQTKTCNLIYLMFLDQPSETLSTTVSVHDKGKNNERSEVECS